MLPLAGYFSIQYIMNAFLSDLFTRKKPLWPGMTDVHSHVLPGVDDGFSLEEESLGMLLFLGTCGVKRLFLTPHIMADLAKNRREFLQERFDLFRSKCADIPVELRLAAEYMLDECFYDRMKEGLLSYDGQHVLVEVSFLQASGDLFEKLYDMQLNGFIPVMAHPERFGFWNIDELLKLKEHGCKFQLNIFSLVGFYGPLPNKTAAALLKRGCYDFVGTDIHSLNYRSFYSSLKLKKDQYEAVERLMRGNETLWG